MALPASGPISGSQIGTELGISTGPYSLRNMSASASFSSPDAMSEFYGYSALTNVTINIGTQTTADGSGNITVYAWTAGNVTVDTNVTVQFLWTGDLSNTINSSVIIYSGTSCSGGIGFVGAAIGEYTSTFDIASLTPTTSATQNYLQGGATTPITSCP
jgi:hypothetical protein